MRRYSVALLVLFACSLRLAPQNGTAPSGYYPPTFHGSIFTGMLESVDADSQEFSLVYTKGSKSERFVGRLESYCRWKEKGGSLHTFKVSDIPKGTVLTAFYNSITRKSSGQKSKENSVFAISYVELNGKKIPDEKRILLSCSDQSYMVFQPY